MSFSDFFRKAHPPRNDITIAFDTDLDINLLYVGVDGNVELSLQGSPTVSKVYKAVNAGTWISLPIKQIKAAGTTSSTETDFVGHQ